MAFEDLLNSVEESAGAKERELRSQAAAAIEEIRSRAKNQAEAIRQVHLEEAETSITAERNKLLYLTKAENKELLTKIREAAFDDAFREAEIRLAGLRSSQKYPAVFENLLREAIVGMGNEAFVLHIDKRDEAVARTAIGALGLSCEVRTDLQTAGGVVASLPDDTICISNTVESRLLRAREHKRKEIHAILSGE
jgi:vacuolar-type H+-ATPase subunit E/Vma4